MNTYTDSKNKEHDHLHCISKFVCAPKCKATIFFGKGNLAEMYCRLINSTNFRQMTLNVLLKVIRDIQESFPEERHVQNASRLVALSFSRTT